MHNRGKALSIKIANNAKVAIKGLN